MEKIKKLYEFLFGNGYNYLIIILIILIAMLSSLIFFPHYLTYEYWSGGKINRSETLRNIGILVLGIFGTYLALQKIKIAMNQLRVSEKGLDIDRLQKAVDLLSEDTSYSRLAGVITLRELAKKSTEYRTTVVSTLDNFLQSHRYDAIQGLDSEINQDDFYKKWLARKPSDQDKIKAFNVLIDLDFKIADVDIIGYHTYKNIYLYQSGWLNLPNASFFNCDFGDTNLKCSEHTRFYSCDLTNTRIYPSSNTNTVIFDKCNVSGLKIQIDEQATPLLNGWHWEDDPPVLDTCLSFASLPNDRRIVRFDKGRIFSLSDQVQYILERKYGFPDGRILPISDDPELDYNKQTLQSGLEDFGNKLNKLLKS
jgi:hypothetical protein